MKTVTLVKFPEGGYGFFNKEIDEKEKEKYNTMSVIDIEDEEFQRINDARIKFTEVEEWVKETLRKIRI